MSATALAVALRKPVIPFVPVIQHHTYRKVSLTAQVNTGTNAAPVNVKRKEDGYYCEVNDPEYILRTVHEFDDLCIDERLKLTDGPKKYAFFRRCLGGTVRDTWDTAKMGEAPTNDGFKATMKKFIAEYITPDGLVNQKYYLDTLKKPYFVSVKMASDRIIMMNVYMQMFPGSNDAAPYDAQEIKHKLYQLMLPEWQLSFANSTEDLNDAAYTYEKLVNFMRRQEDIYTAKNQANNRNRNNSNSTNNYRPGNRFSGNRRPRDNNNQDYGRNTRRRLDHDPNRECPYHDGHNWMDCFGNPNGRNFRSNYVLPPPKSRGYSSNNNNRNQHNNNRDNRSNNGSYGNRTPNNQGNRSSFNNQNNNRNNRDNRSNNRSTHGNGNNNRNRYNDGHFNDQSYDPPPHEHDQNPPDQYNEIPQYQSEYPQHDQYHDNHTNDDRGTQSNPSHDQQDQASSSHTPSTQEQQYNQDQHWLDNLQW